MKKYTQKNLGYTRAKTRTKLKITFSNGEEWVVLAQIIADDRDENYKNDFEDTIGFILTNRLDNCELIDWVANNMNWSDLAPYAKRVKGPDVISYEDEWAESEKEII